MSLDIYEWTLHTLAIIAFTCTAMLIVPFVMIYTNGVVDTDYYQPVFGFLLCLSLFITSIRQPYQNIVEASGHFKQTRNGAIAEALINISISLALTWRWKINGVLIGTVISSVIRTYQYALYASRIIVNRSMSLFYYRIIVSVFNIAFIIFLYFVFDIDSTLAVQNTYFGWFVSAIPVFFAATVITVLMNLIAYQKQFFSVLRQIRENSFMKERI